MISQERRGLTFVELLVLVVIVGVNVGLLVRGMEKIRAAAARSSDRHVQVSTTSGQVRW
jgi:hypothetical protein